VIHHDLILQLPVTSNEEFCTCLLLKTRNDNAEPSRRLLNYPWKRTVSRLASKSIVVNCDNIFKTYEDGDLKVEVLKGLDFSVKAGEFVAIVGTSGSGKTTLVNLMALLDSPTAGEISIDGQSVNGLDDTTLSRLRRDKIGIVFQGFYLLDIMNARENVEVPMVFADIPKKTRIARALELLDLVGMRDFAEQYPTEMSGGQMQRIVFARAIANDPVLLLADEPTGNLDTATGFEIIRLFKELAHNQKKAVVVATHDPEVASSADRILVLRHGRLHTDTSVYGRDSDSEEEQL
jgi:putative ABC transport system ATP-binding protein